MISTGLNAVLIKIAGAGLTTSDLARSLSSMQPKLVSLHHRFGTHPCGEGGEYETFTIDSPLFKSCIDIKVKEIVVAVESDVAPVAYLRIKHALLVKKEATPAASPDIPVPPLLEDPFETLRMHMEKSLDGAASDSASEINSLHPHVLPELVPSVRRIGPWIAVGNVSLPTSHPRPSSVGDEVAHCFDILQSTYRLVAVTLPPMLSTRLACQNFTRICRAFRAPPNFGDHYASPSRPRRIDILFSECCLRILFWRIAACKSLRRCGWGRRWAGLPSVGWGTEWNTGQQDDYEEDERRNRNKKGPSRSELELLGTCEHRSLFASYQCT